MIAGMYLATRLDDNTLTESESRVLARDRKRVGPSNRLVGFGLLQMQNINTTKIISFLKNTIQEALSASGKNYSTTPFPLCYNLFKKRTKKMFFVTFPMTPNNWASLHNEWNSFVHTKYYKKIIIFRVSLVRVYLQVSQV